MNIRAVATEHKSIFIIGGQVCMLGLNPDPALFRSATKYSRFAAFIRGGTIELFKNRANGSKLEFISIEDWFNWIRSVDYKVSYHNCLPVLRDEDHIHYLLSLDKL